MSQKVGSCRLHWLTVCLNTTALALVSKRSNQFQRESGEAEAIEGSRPTGQARQVWQNLRGGQVGRTRKVRETWQAKAAKRSWSQRSTIRARVGERGRSRDKLGVWICKRQQGPRPRGGKARRGGMEVRAAVAQLHQSTCFRRHLSSTRRPSTCMRTARQLFLTARLCAKRTRWRFFSANNSVKLAGRLRGRFRARTAILDCDRGWLAAVGRGYGESRLHQWRGAGPMRSQAAARMVQRVSMGRSTQMRAD